MYLIKAFLLMLFVSLSAFAQKEAPAEGAVPEVKAYSGKQSFEWTDVQKKLAEQKAKLEAQETLVKNLIVEKSHASGSSQNNKNQEIQTEHRKLQKMTEDYNQLSSDYETKFPEKGVKENRIYNRLEVKTIDGIKGDLTLEGRLNKLHSHVLSQYPRANKPKSVVKKNSNTIKKIKSAEPVVQEKDVTEKIVVEK